MTSEPIANPSDAVAWYAILTVPQREDSVIEALSRAGVYGFYPVERKWAVRRIKRPVAGAKPMPDGRHGFWVERKILGGYVFAKIAGTPRWHIIKSMPFISGVLGHLGQPMRLTFDDLQTLHELRQRAADLEQASQQSRKIAFRAGEQVKVTEAGALDGFVSDILSVDARSETVYLRDLLLLGKHVPVRFSQLSHT